MIAGHSKLELENFRAGLIDKGYIPLEIAEGSLYGHYYFSMHDPDGNGVSFHTSHCDDKPA